MAIENDLPPLATICDAYGLTDPSDRDAVERMHSTFRDHHARFVTSIARDMLRDLRQEVAANPQTKVLFLGRDGYSLSIAVRTLDPEFFRDHCKDGVLSRAVAEAAVQDLEQNGGKSFPQVSGFRENTASVSPEDVAGSYQQLTRYLRGQVGVDVGVPGSRVILVDSCLKGTVQELLSATYPETEFEGRYMFYDGIDSDPHPGTKLGYVLHRDEGVGGGLFELPDDPQLTFGYLGAIRTIENSLQGPLGSPKALDDNGPVQRRLVDEQDRTYGINPILAEPVYLKPQVREACKVAALRSVHDAAADVRDGAPLDTAAVQREFTQDVRAWLTHAPDQKPELKALLDNFVHRDDHRLVRQVDKALHGSGLSPEQQTQIWQSFEVASTLPEKQSVLGTAQAMRQQAKGSGAGGTAAANQAAKTERTEQKGFQIG
ncbi:ABC transporter permease [Kribbella shirazensis]|uniref:Uncharacterized protein n=1 Tax=Kribbella shirazensis TaxID=1105143 RepID=A0A7X5V7Y0_9ACTN|nr:ABC transporter permease [Kribbella shirazensis]NIK55582.1 hypothetical protein [Kribbella shirazensis]